MINYTNFAAIFHVLSVPLTLFLFLETFMSKDSLKIKATSLKIHFFNQQDYGHLTSTLEALCLYKWNFCRLPAM